MSRSLKFLQISDLHLDSSLAGNKLQFPLKKRPAITQDTLDALQRALAIARSEQVDVILIPGDVWDDEAISVRTAIQFFDLLESMRDTPVIIAPGNHDPLHSASFYNPAYYSLKSSKQHPSNVVIINSSTLAPLRLSQLPGVAFHGLCFSHNTLFPFPALRGYRAEPAVPGELQILLLHGTQVDDSSAQSADLGTPFTFQEILDTGVHYAALGHCHFHKALVDESGNVRAAYAGSPLARGLDEEREHCVLTGAITAQGVTADSLHCHNVDPREVFRLTVEIDPTVADSATLKERIHMALDAACVAPADIALVELKGTAPAGLYKFDLDQEWCDQQCFHLSVIQRGLHPDYDINSVLNDQAAHKRVDGRFVERLANLIEEARQQGDERRLRLLRMALTTGLDALSGGEVRPRYVH